MYFNTFSLTFCLTFIFHEICCWNRDTLEFPEPTRKPTIQPKVMFKTCALNPEPGPCRGNIDMFHYEIESQTCVKFKWGGCQGNGNRFDSELECMAKCLATDYGATKSIPNWCRLTFDYGYCFGALDRWYYDPLWKVCKKRIYSGCGGNKNNFYNQEQCENVCRFGNGWLTLATRIQPKPGMVMKVLIVNPPETTKADIRPGPPT